MVSTSSRKRKASQPQANSLGRFGIQRAFAAGSDGTAGQSVDEVVVPTGTASQGDLLEAASVPQLAADTQGVSPQVEAKVEALAEVAMAESPAEAVMVEAPAEVNDAEPELTPKPAGQKRQEADAPESTPPDVLDPWQLKGIPYDAEDVLPTQSPLMDFPSSPFTNLHIARCRCRTG